MSFLRKILFARITYKQFICLISAVTQFDKTATLWVIDLMTSILNIVNEYKNQAKTANVIDSAVARRDVQARLSKMQQNSDLFRPDIR